jgi:hypothetical protein
MCRVTVTKGAEMKGNRDIKKRQRLARDLERACVPERPFRRSGPTFIVHPTVTAACAPVLRGIAAALEDETLVLHEDALRAVRTFIRDGESPFFGRDVQAAESEAERLRDIVFGLEMVPDEQRLEIAV